MWDANIAWWLKFQPINSGVAILGDITAPQQYKIQKPAERNSEMRMLILPGGRNFGRLIQE
jgi:hypothetical protein